jgi:hypothetical protein
MANRPVRKDSKRHSIPELHEISIRIKNEILLKNTNRYDIIQILQKEYGYTEITATQKYIDIKNLIKDDFKNELDTLRESHIKLYRQNIEKASEIENLKDQLNVKTSIMARIEKITGLEETTVKHEGNININISPDFLPDNIIKQINES